MGAHRVPVIEGIVRKVQTMFQRQPEPGQKSPSSLDRAVVYSIAAMVAMNVIVFAQQLESVPQLAASTFAGLGLA